MLQDIINAITIYHVLAVVFIIVLILLYIYNKQGPQNIDVLPSMTTLSKKKDIVMPDVTQSTLLGSGSSTVMGFFNLQMGNRTQTYGNNFVPMLFVDNNWWLEIANGSNGGNAVARLRVATNKSQPEIIELPPIPYQKWVFIAILRDGRRFDVIYDNRIAASSLLEHYPVVITSSLSIGNDIGLNGKVAHVIINSSRLSPDEVERQRKIYVTTNNEVVEDNSIIASLPTITLAAECPPGLPCDNVTKPPLNKMYKWKTPYA